MSFTELKAEVSHLSDAELDELAICVRLARKSRDPHWLERVARSNAEMDSGRAHSEADLLRVHEELENEGR
jgi:hypothetical protein